MATIYRHPAAAADLRELETSNKPIRPLTVSTLYPSAARPHHGVFVENRLRHLVDLGTISPRVIAPVPWVPTHLRSHSAYQAFAATPARAYRHGIKIDHPRFLTIPKVGMTAQPYLLYQSLRRHVGRLIEREGRPDLIDAHYMYPDGVAAALLARDLDLPLVITVRGTDINLIPDHRLPRAWIRWAIERADHLIAVCQALADRLVELGADPGKVTVLRNGVDLALFRPEDRVQNRKRWAVSGPTLLTVGGLIERKGIDLILHAMTGLSDYRLLIAGEGPLQHDLEELARKLGIDDRVRFLGPVAHEQLPGLYEAADISILASSREGWANVLLESLACGTPVVASNVWGSPEVVTCAEAGRLLDKRDPASIIDAVRDLARHPPAREATRAFAEQFSWDATAIGQQRLFAQVLARRGSA